MSKNVHGALLLARSKFGPVLKSKTNPHFKSKYADLQGVLDAVEDALSECGLVLVQRTEVKDGGAVVLVTELVHVETNGTIASVYPLTPAKPNDPQALGGAMTYARRYSALALLGLAPEDDDGNEASGRGQQRQQAAGQRQQQAAGKEAAVHPDEIAGARMALEQAETVAALVAVWSGLTPEMRKRKDLAAVKDARKTALGGAKK